MNPTSFEMERSIARCRVFLSLVTSFVLYVDPTPAGAFSLGPHWRAVLAAHLLYSLALLVAGRRHSSKPLSQVAACGDVLFSAAVATVTEGTASPFYTFFAFAVLAAGLRSGLRSALLATAVSVGLYIALIVFRAPPDEHLALLARAAYIAITGYLVGYFGEQRLRQEARIRQLEATAERERIARSLHDGYAQALSGVNLRLETCRELFRRGREADALAELTELQVGVNREHDELRAYIRSLVDLEKAVDASDAAPPTKVAVDARFTGSSIFVEHVLLIMLEGVRNVRRHAHADTATIVAQRTGDELEITIDDDGIGFPDDVDASWSIASRVAECRGRLAVPRDGRVGGHVLVQLPVS
jgi:signal transduction histidine kinase